MRNYLLLYCRHRANYSAKKVARLLDLSTTHYQWLEEGNLDMTKEMAEKLEKAFVISADDFLRDAKRLEKARDKINEIEDTVWFLDFPEKQKEHQKIYR